MIYCLRLICLEAAMNILIPFGNYWLGWQQPRRAVGALGWLPAERTPACPPGAVAGRLSEQWKFIVICCGNKNNAVGAPRNFWRSQQICGWHLQPVKQIYGLCLGSYCCQTRWGRNPEGNLASPVAVTAGSLPATLFCRGDARCGRAAGRDCARGRSCTRTNLTALMELLNLTWGTT